jgi:hypothetical protein
MQGKLKWDLYAQKRSLRRKACKNFNNSGPSGTCFPDSFMRVKFAKTGGLS